jgi:hypothetical protein
MSAYTHSVPFKRWQVIYQDDAEFDLTHTKCFLEFEDAVILAKQTGVNQVYDRIEMVFIDL